MLRHLQMGSMFDYSSMDLTELQNEQKMLHVRMVEVFIKQRDDFSLVMLMSSMTLLFPISIAGKRLYAKLTGTKFIITIANLIDLSIVLQVLIMLGMTRYYEQREIPMDLFTKEDDMNPSIRFVANMMADIEADVFRFDYLLAAGTATLWIRCVILLRL